MNEIPTQPPQLEPLVPVERATMPVAVVPVPRALSYDHRLEFKTTCRDYIAAGVVHLVLDCAETGYVDSSGLGVILSISRLARLAGGGVVLRNVTGDFRELLRLTALDTVLMVEEPVL